MPTYLIYTRVSPRGSDWQGETSCEAQADECRRYLKAKGDGKVIGVVQDEFISGGTNQRPALQKILADSRAGRAKWDVLVVHDIDRLVKSQRGWYKILDTLRDAGKTVIAVRQNIDYSNPYGSYTMDNLVRSHQLMREIGADNTRRKMVWMARQGLWPAGKVPYGYKRGAAKDNILHIDPQAAPIIQDIFASYAAGLTVTEIQRKHKLPKNTIHKRLRNPIYIGRLVYADVNTQGQHKPIISQELWDKVQSRLPRTVKGRRPNRSHREYLLAGLIYCECGRTMSPTSAKGRHGKRYHHYRCQDTAHCPHREYIPADSIEQAVKDQILTLTQSPAMVKAIQDQVAQSASATRAAVEPTIDAIATRISAAKEKLTGLTEAISSGFLTSDNASYINDQITQLRNTITNLQEERRHAKRQLEQAMARAQDSKSVVKTWNTIARAILATGQDPTAQRGIIHAHIKRIDRQGQDFRVTYTLPPSKRGSPNSLLWHPIGYLVELMLRVG